jgi:hypothetical protein
VALDDINVALSLIRKFKVPLSRILQVLLRVTSCRVFHAQAEARVEDVFEFESVTTQVPQTARIAPSKYDREICTRATNLRQN